MCLCLTMNSKGGTLLGPRGNIYETVSPYSDVSPKTNPPSATVEQYPAQFSVFGVLILLLLLLMLLAILTFLVFTIVRRRRPRLFRVPEAKRIQGRYEMIENVSGNVSFLVVLLI